MPDLRDMPARLRALAAAWRAQGDNLTARASLSAADACYGHANAQEQAATDLEAALAGARVLNGMEAALATSLTDERTPRFRFPYLVIPMEPDRE